VKKSAHFSSNLEPPGVPWGPASCSTARASSNPSNSAELADFVNVALGKNLVPHRASPESGLDDLS
jgi:hypothetical protein